jgi:hypothetical protein
MSYHRQLSHKSFRTPKVTPPTAAAAAATAQAQHNQLANKADHHDRVFVSSIDNIKPGKLDLPFGTSPAPDWLAQCSLTRSFSAACTLSKATPVLCVMLSSGCSTFWRTVLHV